jgi:3-hydroxybutyryl-CoA dehydrogenase
MAPPFRMGVVGSGTMGRGIVQLFAVAGHEVVCFDVLANAAQAGVEQVLTLLRRSVEKGRMSAADLQSVAGRIRIAGALAECAACDVVIEAVIEDLGVKVELFRQLESLVTDQAILATNTSSLSVSAIAAGCRRPERVAGLHFFNPVPLMKIAEIIPGLRTAPAVTETLRALIAATGHRAVVAADQPGFLVNHAGRGLYTEGLRVLEERVADVADIDGLLRDAAGFRMGPFELLDLTGLDVSCRVMESIYEQFYQEPRFRPSPLVRPRVAAGLFGRKTQRGWYAYDSAVDARTPERGAAALDRGAVAPGLRVWIDPAADERPAMAPLIAAVGGEISASPAEADLILVQFWGEDATGYCQAQGLDARRCVAVDPLPGLTRRRTLMQTAATSREARDAARVVFESDGVECTIINDSLGFVVQRVLATIVNIAADLAQRGIADVADIEAAVTLGLGYPHGPLSWGDQIGAHRILMILDRLLAASGDTRYRASPWLRRRAALGLSLLSPEPER